MKTICSISLLVIGMLIAACDSSNYDSKPDLSSLSDSYLPLQVGNYWNFVPTGISNSEYTLHKEITGKATLQGHEYYMLVSTSSGNDYSYKDTLYLRIDNSGYVYSRTSNSAFEVNAFRLKGSDGDSWTYAINDRDKAIITLDDVDVEINSTMLKDCKAYHFNVDNWVDEEYTRTLAKGIGFVKEYSDAWGFGEILTSARIDGNEINF
ncbi:MAG TPA: hypothetical protein VIM65_19920 [Cyclobacteriaceae bacterium]